MALYDGGKNPAIKFGPVSGKMADGSPGRYDNYKQLYYNNKPQNVLLCTREGCHMLLKKWGGQCVPNHENKTCPSTKEVAQKKTNRDLFEKKSQPIENPALVTEVRNRIAHAIINMCMSFSMGGSDEFRELLTYISKVTMQVMHVINFNQKGLVGRRIFLSKTVKHLNSQLIKKLIKLMGDDSVSAITITLDHWKDSSSKREYLGVTASFIGRKMGNPDSPPELINVVLALIPVDSHCSEQLIKDFEKLVAFYGIEDKIRFVVTDGCPSNKKSFGKNDSYRRVLDKYAEYEEGFLEAVIEKLEDPEADEIPQLLQKLPDPIEGQLFGIRWVWCVAHKIQLATQHAFNDLKKKNPEDHLTILVEACKYTVSCLHRSAAAAKLNKCLATDCNVRWDSKSAMVKSVIEPSIRDELKKIGKETTNEKLADAIQKVTSESARAILSDFVNIMEEVTKHRLTMSAAKYPTLGTVLFVRQVLLLRLEEKKNVVEGPVKEFLTNLISQIRKYITIDEPMLVAAILNPHYSKHCLATFLKIDDGKGVVDYFTQGKQLIQDMLKEIEKEDPSEAAPAFDPDDDRALFADPAASSSQKDELESYLNEDKRVEGGYNGIVEWFRVNKSKYPNLYSLVMHFLAPATSVSAERLFSIAGLKIGKTAHNLHPETLQALLMYYCNSHLIAKGIVSMSFTDKDIFYDEDADEEADKEDFAYIE